MAIDSLSTKLDSEREQGAYDIVEVVENNLLFNSKNIARRRCDFHLVQERNGRG